MKAEECKVQQILTENKIYKIPSYQRPYSWTKEESLQLIKDIDDSCLENNREYFIGSLICIKSDKNIFEVVDGQQRLTTLSLILTCLKNLIDREQIKQDIEKRILPIDPYSDQIKEPRLLVREKEYSLYHNYILQGNDVYKPKKPSYTESLFIGNFEAIADYLSLKSQDELADLAKYIQQNVSLVCIQTDDLASSFRLFNVLNSRGMSLSQSDLLKNYVFESVSKISENYKHVKKLWQDIEDLVGVDSFDKFLMAYRISEKKVRDRVVSKSYNVFIEEIKTEFNDNVIQFLENLYLSAKLYSRLHENSFDDEFFSIRKNIRSLSYFCLSESMPPIIAILKRYYSKKDISTIQVIKFINLYEKVYTQGWLCKLIKSKREMVVYSALVSINNGASYENMMKTIYHHVDNNNTRRAIREPIYDRSPNMIKLVKAIFFRLEDEIHDENIEKSYQGRITIEHILPQSSDITYWNDRFTSEDKEMYLHTLGNLMLLSGSKNSEAQNGDFLRKKDIYLKKNKPSFELTKEVSMLNDWNIDNFHQRQSNLISKIENIWLVPSSLI